MRTVWGRATVVLLGVIGLLLLVHTLPGRGASLATAPDVAWAEPVDTSVHNLGPVTPGDDERSYDCTPLTYRMIDDLSKTMQSGCFVRTAFGMLDPDRPVAIFNGSDEGEYIKLGGNPAAISVLPGSVSVARFGGFPVMGTYMYLYTYFPEHLEQRRDLHLQRYKELTGTPNFTVSDSSGQPLPVNPQALAYSARGQWLVTESPGHSLVRINLATFSVLPFDKSYDIAGKPYAGHSASMAATEDGRYAAAASNEFSWLKVYDLSTCGVTDNPDPLAPQTCKSHDYWPLVAGQVTGSLRSISHVRFVNDGLLSFDAVTSTGTESYLLSPSGSISALIPYLGLGDSFASGQGAFDYVAGTDSAINACHVSVHAYPLRLNGDIFANQGHSVACSGATIHDVGDTAAGYTGQSSEQKTAQEREADGSEVTILHDFSPGFVAQQRFATAYQPGVITVEIGGNDVGFKDMLLRCLSPLSTLKKSGLNPNSCYTSYEDRLEIEQTIDRIYPKWVQLYRQLQKTAPLARIYAVGYPQIMSGNGRCGLNVPATAGDIQFARDATNYLNGVMQKAARAAGVNYIDVSNALAGHELCDSSPLTAVNGLTAGTDIHGVIGQESFHPTAYGHELLEQALLSATNHFAASDRAAANPAETPPVPASSDPLLQAPTSGRTTNRVSYDDTLAPASAAAGQGITIHSSGITTGLQPSSDYTVNLGDDQVIGSGQTDDQGSVTTTVTIPPESTTGTQPITVTGTGQDGSPTTVTTVIDIYGDGEDYDGDGIPNAQDSCPLAPNSGIDADGDGIDDACDAVIAAGGSSGDSAGDNSNNSGTATGTTGSGQTSNSSGTGAPLSGLPDDTTNPQAGSTPVKATPEADANAAQTLQISGITSVQDAQGLVTASILQSGLPKPKSIGQVLAHSKSLQPNKLGVARAQNPRLLSTVHRPTAFQRSPLTRFLWYVWLTLLLVMVGAYYLCRVLLVGRPSYA